MMPDSEHQARQKEAFKQALQKVYTACIFDIDGTLTVHGDEYIPAFLQPRLAAISMEIPMAVCTGRRLQHALDKLAPLFMHATDPLHCQANWMLVCENGAVAYTFDLKNKKYEEFYRENYPYPEEIRSAMFYRIRDRLGNLAGDCFMNVVGMVFRPQWEGIQLEEVKKRSREIAMIVQREVAPYDPKGLLKVGDSGIGVTVFPTNSTKQRGIAEFARFLASSRGFRLSPEAREIVAIGDQPGPLGNDEDFLKGILGTPFTVGETNPENLMPLPVFDEIGAVLKGPEATMFLLESLRFRDSLALRSKLKVES
jgi:hypothetical protein